MRPGLRRREKQKKKSLQEMEQQQFHIPWLPQKRQLTFLKAVGLDYPFLYYVDEDEEGNLIKVKRSDVPDGPQPPKADIIAYGGAAGGG